MANFHSMYEGEENINAMIDHFRHGNGEEYSSPLLTKLVAHHPSTRRFMADVGAALTEEYYNNNDVFNDISKLNLEIVGNPRYNTWDDFFGGLQIAINDMKMYDVDVLLVVPTEGGVYVYVEVILYDHFGLDPDDIIEYDTQGFRSWFILQHE